MIPKLSGYEAITASDIPKNKVNWTLDPSKAAFLIHDMQEYFLDFWGEESPFVVDLVRKIQALRKFCKKEGIPVFYTAQPINQDPKDRALLNDFWGPGIDKRPERQPIVSALAPEEGDQVLTKWRYSAFQRTPLEKILKDANRDQLIITGVYAHIGCLATAEDAFMRDIKPFFIADALADFSREKHIMALQIGADICARVLSSDTLVAGVPETIESLRQVVYGLLEDDDDLPEDDDNLGDFGLDSVRIMDLAARWQKANKALKFEKLAQSPSINAWWALLSAKETN